MVLAVLVAAGALALVLAANEDASAATITVPDDFTSIQTAVDKASPGDTIHIRAGTYAESVEVDKQLTIRGDGKDVTIVNGDKGYAIKMTADGVRMMGLRLRLGTIYASLFIVEANDCTVDSVICRNSNVGIWVQGGGGHTFRDVTCTRNDRQGLFFNGTSDNLFVDSACGYNYDGVMVTGGVNNTFENTLMRFNQFRGCAFTSDSDVEMDGIVVRDCLVHNNGGVPGAGNAGISSDNVDNLWILNCTVINNEGNGIYVQPYYLHTSSVWIKSTNSSGNKYDGIYSALTKSVFIEDCILTDSTNGAGIYMSRAYSESLIANCTIRNNQGTGFFDSGLVTRHNKNQLIYNCTITDHPMYGIYLLRDSSPQPAMNVSIVDCVLEMNSEVGIAFSTGPNEDILIKDCTISHSVQGIARVELDHEWPSTFERLTVRDCTITDCSNGTSITKTTVANSTFDGCVIQHCTNGLYLQDLNDSVVTDCTITSNTHYGASIYTYGSEIWNNNISVNWFGGIWLTFGVHGDEVSRFHNNTLRNNRFIMGGFGIYVAGIGPGTVEHNLLSNNENEIYISYGRARDFFHNIISNSSQGIYDAASSPTDRHRFYLNSFINNGIDVDPGMNFIFDNGELGNYWDDYTTRYPNANPVGLVWDTPYMVAPSIFDRYPLVGVPDGVAPIAVAGDDQSVPSGTEVEFDGSLSSDNVGIVNYTWSFAYDGEATELYDAQPSFTFVTLGTYTVTLTVRDAWDNTAVDTMSVEVYDDEPPVANAGEDVEAGTGETFTLDGSASTDNVAIASYQWTVDPGGLDRVFDTMTVETSIDAPGEYIAVLNVTDTSGLWATDTVLIVVLDTEAPVADAGEDVEMDQGDTTTLDGSGSSDNVGIVSYVWTTEEEGETVVLSEDASFDLMSTEPGVYSITLNVTDAAGNWDTDEVMVTVLDTEAPVADAGDDVTVTAGTEVDFDGSGSTDNVDIVLHTWTFVYDGETRTLEGVEASFTFDIPGEYEVTLRVNDAADNWASDQMTVTVSPSGEDTTPPVADAGEDQEIPVGMQVLFNGEGSTDDVGVVSYVWTFSYEGMTQTVEGERARFTFDVAGEYVVTLTVADASGNEDTDTMTVRVLAEGERTWRLGPFEDTDGEPVEGVKVEVTLNGQVYEATTDEGGMAVLTVAIDDLVSPASVTATLEGWNALEFDIALDDDGDPDGDIPAMERVSGGGGEEGSSTWIYVLVVVAVVVVLLLVAFLLRGSI